MNKKDYEFCLSFASCTFTDSQKLIGFWEKKRNLLNRPLYKYYSAPSSPDEFDKSHGFQNFKGEKVHLDDVSSYNDPFDCASGYDWVLNSTKALNRLKNVDAQEKEVLSAFFSAFNREPRHSKEKALENMRSSVRFLLSKSRGFALCKGWLFEILVLPGNEELFYHYHDHFFTELDRERYAKAIQNSPHFSAFVVANHLQELAKVDPKAAAMKLIPPFPFLSTKSLLTAQEKDEMSFPYPLMEGVFTRTEINHFLCNKENMEKEMKSFDKKGQELFRVSCFSEVIDNVLMWSHYANKHEGFALAYDFTKNDASRDMVLAATFTIPVAYSNSRPKVDADAFENSLKRFFRTFSTKAEDWKYEKEWRTIVPTASVEDSFLKIPPTSLYLGCNINPKNKKKLMAVACDQKIHVFQAEKSPSTYRLLMKQIL